MTQSVIPTTGPVGRTSLTTAVGPDADQRAVLGYIALITTGDVLVHHDWASAAFDAHGVPRHLLPKKATPTRAFRKAMTYLVYPSRFERFTRGDYDVTVDLPKVEPNLYEFHARVKTDEDADGDAAWTDFTLGTYRWDPDEETFYATARPLSGHVATDADLAGLWTEACERADVLYGLLLHSYTADDMRDIWSTFASLSRAVLLRDGGGAYFIPAHHGPTLDGLAAVWRDLQAGIDDQTNKRVIKMGVGIKTCRVGISTTIVLDTDEWIDEIEAQAESRIEQLCRQAVTAATRKMNAPTKVQKTADEVVRAVAGQLRDAEAVRDDYNSLLQAQLSVERILIKMADDAADEAERAVISEALTTVRD